MQFTKRKEHVQDARADAAVSRRRDVAVSALMAQLTGKNSTFLDDRDRFEQSEYRRFARAQRPVDVWK